MDGVQKIAEFIAAHPMAAVIAAGEIGFWVCILAGLISRYVLRMRRTSTALLAATPLIDLMVLIATMVDLSHGAQASLVHGLAAVYLGFSVVFGPAMIRWADVRFAHRFAGGPAPRKPYSNRHERLRYEWREWGKCLLACGIAAAVMLVLIFAVGTPEQTRPLWADGGWLPKLGLVVVIWFAVGPLWASLSGRSAGEDAAEHEDTGRAVDSAGRADVDLDHAASGSSPETGYRPGPIERIPDTALPADTTQPATARLATATSRRATETVDGSGRAAAQPADRPSRRDAPAQRKDNSMAELLGILVLIQGVGGLINRVAGSDANSWFLQLHLLPPSWHIAASAVMTLIGAAVVFPIWAKRKRRA